jgi:GINS complex subunit 4
MHSRLSEAELGHARRFATMLERHLEAAVLQGLPEVQRSLDDTTAFMPPMSECKRLFAS